MTAELERSQVDSAAKLENTRAEWTAVLEEERQSAQAVLEQARQETEQQAAASLAKFTAELEDYQTEAAQR